MKLRFNYDVSNCAPGFKVLLEDAGLQRVLNRKRVDRGLLLFPEIRSDDSAYLNLAERLARRLTDALPASVNDDGTSGENATPGNFYALLNTAGHQMSPRSVPPLTNDPIRSRLGLVSEFVSKRHREIFRAVLKAMFEVVRPSKVSIRRTASTCSPNYVDDVSKKKTELRHALENLDRFLDLVDRGDFARLFTEFNATIVQTLGFRIQADKVTLKGTVFSTKEREVNDELAARSGLTEGTRRPADKRVVVHGVTLKNHFATRVRNVYGFSFVPNYVIATIFSCAREYYLHEYEFTWKHRTPASILEKMRKFAFLVGFDVKEFDTSVGRFLIDFFCDELQNYLDPRMVKLIRYAFRAPYIVPYPYGESEQSFNPFFGADPFDADAFDTSLGLPSGIACNPDFGKWAMTSAYLCLVDDQLGNILETGIPAILRGEHPDFALLNMSDDCVLLTNNATLANRVRTGELSSPYFAVEPESPISFLGNVPYRDYAGELRLAPNIISFFVNWLVPEHGIDSRNRRDFWAVGDRERRQHYASAPGYPDAYAIYEEEFVQTYGRTPSSITSQFYDQQKKLTNLSAIDSLVLNRPDYLYYRFDEDDVSPDVLDQIVTSLPKEEVWPLVSHVLHTRHDDYLMVA